MAGNEPAQRIAQAWEKVSSRLVGAITENNIVHAQCRVCWKYARYWADIEHAGDCPIPIISDALKLVPTATPKADRLIELADEQCITDRDRYEEALGDIAYRLGCREEWSNNHSHLDCIYELLPDPAPLAGTWSREIPQDTTGWYWYKDKETSRPRIIEVQRGYRIIRTLKENLFYKLDLEGWYWPVPLAAPEFVQGKEGEK